MTTQREAQFDHARLIVHRKKRQMSQRALASAVGISQASIAELEHGKRPPSKDVAEKIALALGIGVRELLKTEFAS